MKQLLLMAILFSQITAYAQYQVQKGHWFIGHTIGGYAFTKMVWKASHNGGPDEGYTSRNNAFELGFSGPDWGSAEIGSNRSTDESTGNESKQNSTAITLRPQAGYFVRDNLMIGASALMGLETEKSIGPGSSGRGRSWALGIGPMMRYYFGKNSKRKFFTGFESRFDMARSKEKHYYSDNFEGDRNEYDTKGSNEMIMPFVGYALFLGKRWTTEMRADYTYSKETVKHTQWYYEDETLDQDYPKTENLVITTNRFAINLGITYTF